MFRKKSKKQKWSGGDGSEGWVVRTLRAFTYAQYMSSWESEGDEFFSPETTNCILITGNMIQIHSLTGPQVQLDSLRWWCEESICMQSGICELLPSTVCPQLVQSAFISKEIGSAFPLLRSLGAIMAWSSCVQYHSLPNTFQTHLKQTADHYHWLLIVVNHES